MTHICPAVVAFIFTLLTATDASITCAWTKVLSNDEVHYSFLRGDPTSPRLYHSIWSASRALLSCSFSDNRALTQKYSSVCLDNTREFSHEPHLSLMFDEESCRSMDSPRITAAEEHTATHKRPVRSAGSFISEEDVNSEAKLRVKRGFIVPGTLWCGSGNKAPSYADLGVFSETDKCCREHDQCQDTILSFHSKFGVFNSNIFTMSHCDCDNKFRSCLSEAQDSISDVVGYTFFNLLKMHCFEFSHKLQCTERNWFGMCKETKMSLYAEVHPPTLYESDTPANVTSISNTTSPENTIESALFPVTAVSTLPETTTTQNTSTTPGTSETPATTPARPQGPATATAQGYNQTVPLPDADITEKQKSCALYKDLDECGNRILPLQRKYGFQNNEPRTMYHCNCTNRFFQTLSNQMALTEVDTVLLDLVSPSCFVLQDCSAGQICTVVVLTAEHPQVESSSSSGAKEQRRHLQTMGVRVRRPNLKRAARRKNPTRLQRLCLRMVLPRLNKNKRQRARQDVRKIPE